MDIGYGPSLLDTGLIDVNGRSEGGGSALHAARIRGNTELAEFLITREADPKIGKPVSAL